MRGLVLSVIAVCWMGSAIAATPPEQRSRLLARIEQQASVYDQLSLRLWELAETGFREHNSAALIQEHLRKAGFRLESGIGGVPTAFIASWGQGAPVVSILGEYDALPGLSQQAVAERKPVTNGAPGHGCGHNLLGAASTLVAVAVKEQMGMAGLSGTIRFYGTPAEEGGGGKIFMIRAGAFRDADVVLAWHPSTLNAADNQSWLANISAKFRFSGTAAHAAAAPDSGRSALDAVEIMAHAVNLMREHVPQQTRIHYIITNGGSAANIVPESAELSLIARHPDSGTLENIWERIVQCAQAGALATQTRVEIQISSSYASFVTNPTLVSLLDANLRHTGGVRYSPAEESFAAALLKQVVSPPAFEPGQQERIFPPRTELMSASSDVGDVSWVVPTGHLLAATFPPGIPFHTWQATAAAGSSLGRKGMLVAAKALALTALDILYEPALAARAKADWQKALGGRHYKSLLPPEARPQLHTSEAQR